MFRTRIWQWKAWKPRRRWERAQAKKRLLDEQLREDLKPTYTTCHRGIVVNVHVVRSFTRKRDLYFEFGRYETDRKRFYFKQVFSEDDFDDLIEAIELVREDARRFRRDGFINGFGGSGRGSAGSRLPVRRG